MKSFQPNVRLTNQKLSRACFVSVRQTNQIALFPFVCSLCIVRVFSFQGHTKTLYCKDQYATCGVCSSQPTLIIKRAFFATLETRRKLDCVNFEKDLWDRYWGRAGQLLANFFPVPSNIPISLCEG